MNGVRIRCNASALAEKTIDDDAVSAVLKAAGVDVDAARVKALVFTKWC